MSFLKIWISVGLMCASAAHADLEDVMRKKKRFFCRDIIAFVTIYPLPSDPDINKIWNFAFQLCLSKVSLRARYHGSRLQAEKDSIKKELEKLMPLIHSTLYALRLSFLIFSDPYNLRERLTELFHNNRDKKADSFLLIE